MTEYKLSKNVINNIAQLLQLAMLTQTDISDHFQLIRLSPSGLSEDTLELSKDYAKTHEERVQKLAEEAQKLAMAEAKKAQKNSAGFVN